MMLKENFKYKKLLDATEVCKRNPLACLGAQGKSASNKSGVVQAHGENLQRELKEREHCDRTLVCGVKALKKTVAKTCAHMVAGGRCCLDLP